VATEQIIISRKGWTSKAYLIPRAPGYFSDSFSNWRSQARVFATITEAEAALDRLVRAGITDATIEVDSHV
jgi:hypothetical protein